MVSFQARNVFANELLMNLNAPCTFQTLYAMTRSNALNKLRPILEL